MSNINVKKLKKLGFLLQISSMFPITRENMINLSTCWII